MVKPATDNSTGNGLATRKATERADMTKSPYVITVIVESCVILFPSNGIYHTQIAMQPFGDTIENTSHMCSESMVSLQMQFAVD